MTTIASGMTMRLLPKTFYAFDKLQASQSQAFAVCQHIDVSVFQEVTFTIRGHSGTIGTGASIAFTVGADGYTLDDPGLSFVATSDANATPFGTFSFASTTTFPAVAILTVAKPSARLLVLSVTGTQGGTVVSCNGAFSVDLTCKGGDPASLPLDYNTYRGYRI